MSSGPACAGADPEIFFTIEADESPDLTSDQRYKLNKRNKQKALELCMSCPLRVACLEQNITTPYGIFGGKTAMERRRLAEAAELIPVQHGPVGWVSAYPETAPYLSHRVIAEDTESDYADVPFDVMVTS